MRTPKRSRWRTGRAACPAAMARCAKRSISSSPPKAAHEPAPLDPAAPGAGAVRDVLHPATHGRASQRAGRGAGEPAALSPEPGRTDPLRERRHADAARHRAARRLFSRSIRAGLRSAARSAVGQRHALAPVRARCGAAGRGSPLRAFRPVLAEGHWPDDGSALQARTEQLWIDPDLHEIETDAAVELQGELRKGHARGLRADWSARNLWLLHDVQMQYEAPH